MPERIDMTEFEKQFSEGRYNDDLPNSDFEQLHFLRDRIADISGTLEMRKSWLSLNEIRIAAFQAALRRLDKLAAKIRAKRDPIVAEQSKTKAEIREDERRLSDYERQLKRLLDEIEARRRFLAERTLLDHKTDDLPWRVGREKDGRKALPHQLEGAHRLVSANRAILGDKPGLGKTLEAIITIDLLRAQGKAQKVLVLTPKPVLKDFERAFQMWTKPTFVHVLNQTLKGIKTEILSSIQHFPQAIVLTNYEVWRKDSSIHEKLIHCAFDTVILDEGHLLKSAKSATSKAVREIIYAENQCPNCKGQNIVNHYYGLKCGTCEHEAQNFGDFCSVKNVYPMTGTPILNKPGELWPLLNLIDREGFPDENRFLRDYCVQQYDYANDRRYWTFGPGGSEKLLKRLGFKYTARNRDSAGVKMPPQEIKHHWLELDPEKYPKQAKFIQILRDKARLAFSEDVQMTTQAVLAWYTRMRQAASWPDGIQIKGCEHIPSCESEGLDGCINPTVIFPKPGDPRIGESVMMDEAEDIIREAVEDGDRIVVFSMFKGVLKELLNRCDAAGIRAVRFDGDTPDKMRQTIVDDFNTNHTKVGEHQFDVMLCQYQTGRVGLNLNGAQQLLCVEREWNPGMEEQTIDRLRRIDSEYESIVHILHCAGTATELIDAIQEQKKNMLDGFEADVDLQEAMRKFLEG